MFSEKLLGLFLMLTLSLVYSVLNCFNFLWLVIIWLAIKEDWLMIFVGGLIFDLVTGMALGLSSFKFLVFAVLVYLIKEYWPMRIQRDLKLRI